MKPFRPLLMTPRTPLDRPLLPVSAAMRALPTELILVATAWDFMDEQKRLIGVTVTACHYLLLTRAARASPPRGKAPTTLHKLWSQGGGGGGGPFATFQMGGGKEAEEAACREGQVVVVGR